MRRAKVRLRRGALLLAGAALAALALVLVATATHGDGRNAAPAPLTRVAERGAAEPTSAVGVADLEVDPRRTTARPAAAIPPAGAPRWQQPFAELPPRELPVIDVMDALLARAEAGDARAACRLGTELAECALGLSPREARQMRENIDIPPGPAGEPLRRAVAETLEDAERRQARCAGLDRDTHHLAFDLILLAAELGHVPSRWGFFEGAGLLGPRMAERPQNFQRYTEAAPELLRAHVESGSVEGALAYLHALEHDDTLLAAAVADDPVEATAIRELLQVVAPHHVMSAGPHPGPVDARAARRATSLLEGPFANTVPWPAPTRPPPPPPPQPPVGGQGVPPAPPPSERAPMVRRGGATLLPASACD